MAPLAQQRVCGAMSTQTRAKPWKSRNPAKTHTKLTPKSKAKAKAAAARAGRRYPNLVDNMNAAKAQKAAEKKSRSK